MGLVGKAPITGRSADRGLGPPHLATAESAEMDRLPIGDRQVGRQRLPEGREPKASRGRRAVGRRLSGGPALNSRIATRLSTSGSGGRGRAVRIDIAHLPDSPPAWTPVPSSRLSGEHGNGRVLPAEQPEY